MQQSQKALLIGLIFIAAFSLYRVFESEGESRASDASLSIAAGTAVDSAAPDHSEAGDQRSAQLESTIRKLQVELNALRDSNRQLRREFEDMRGTLNTVLAWGSSEMSVEPDLIDPSADPAESLLADAGRAEERQLARHGVYGDIFDNEVADRDWSGDTLSMIYTVADEVDLPASTVSTADCRATMCRVEVIHEDQDALDEFNLEFAAEVGVALPKISYHQKNGTDGSLVSVMYLARQGHELPDTGERL